MDEHLLRVKMSEAAASTRQPLVADPVRLIGRYAELTVAELLVATHVLAFEGDSVVRWFDRDRLERRYEQFRQAAG